MLLVAFLRNPSPLGSIQSIRKLLRRRDQFLGYRRQLKYALIDGKYFTGLGTPKWPSPAFSRFIDNQLSRGDQEDLPLLDSLTIAVTKKCTLESGQKETLSREQLAAIVNRFSPTGVSMVEFSGNEPLHRFNDLLYVLTNSPRNIEYWINSNGFAMTREKARQLKAHGLTGVAISLNHYQEEQHDLLQGVKGSFRKALEAATNCEEVGLAVCFSFCADPDNAEGQQTEAYAELALSTGVSMIRAITYHQSNGRNTVCEGGNNSSVYVDTDGFIHSCPFCQQQLYHALDENLYLLLHGHQKIGCNRFSPAVTIAQPQKLAI